VKGHEHYQRAEQLAEMASDLDGCEDYAHEMYLLAQAQVHATLALAAATVLHADGAGRLDSADQHSWVKAGVLR
jgi:hypothetical protein